MENAFRKLIAGETGHCISQKPRGAGSPQGPAFIFPGSFNPCHAGHLEMAKLATTKQSLPLWFEISIHNVEKRSLSLAELAERASQDFLEHGLVFTTAKTFVEKSELFPTATFIVGADTIIRIGDPKFYSSTTEMETWFNRWLEQGTRFLVFERQQNGVFFDLGRLEPSLAQLCDWIPRSVFSMPVSSSEIRAKRKLL